LKKHLSLSALLTIALLIVTACQSASTANMTANNANKALPNNAAPKADDHGHADDAPRIALADAKKDFDAGTAIFVDTRDESAYKNEHIKGSINISMNTIEAKYKELPKDKKIIAYCS
jgi:hypothetical protein